MASDTAVAWLQTCVACRHAVVAVAWGLQWPICGMGVVVSRAPAGAGGACQRPGAREAASLDVRTAQASRSSGRTARSRTCSPTRGGGRAACCIPEEAHDGGERSFSGRNNKKDTHSFFRALPRIMDHSSCILGDS